jgi:hypothetical protein
MITFIVFDFASGCVYIAGSLITYFSVMEHNSFGMALTVHEILSCGLPMTLTGQLKAASSVDYQ